MPRFFIEHLIGNATSALERSPPIGTPSGCAGLQRARRSVASELIEGTNSQSVVAFLNYLEKERHNSSAAATPDCRPPFVRALRRGSARPELLEPSRRIRYPAQTASRPLLGFLTRDVLRPSSATDHSWTGRRDHLLFLPSTTPARG
jgi:hypothetical protein